MEQQSQAKVRQETERRDQTEQTRQTPERARLSSAGYTLRGVLAGESLFDLPPSRLEELAMWLGNQNMAALLEGQAQPVALTPFVLPNTEPDTAPISVPEEPLSLAAPPQGLTAGETAGWAFDPAGLSDGGGASRGL